MPNYEAEIKDIINYKPNIWIKERYRELYIIFPTTKKEFVKITCKQIPDREVISIKGEAKDCRLCGYRSCEINSEFACDEVPPNHLPRVGDCISLTYHLNFKPGYIKLKYYVDARNRILFAFTREPQSCGKGLMDLETYKETEFEVIPEQGRMEIVDSRVWGAPGIKIFVQLPGSSNNSTNKIKHKKWIKRIEK